MTLEEFFVALEQTPRDWFLCSNFHGRKRALRRMNHADEPCCPITAVEEHQWNAGRYNDAAVRLGLACSVVDVVDAADGSPRLSSAQRRIRKQLLRACGLAPSPSAGAEE